MSVGTA